MQLASLDNVEYTQNTPGKTSPGRINPLQSAFRFRRTRPTSLHSRSNASDVPAGPASATPTSITGNLHVCAAVSEDSPRHSARGQGIVASLAPSSTHGPSLASLVIAARPLLLGITQTSVRPGHSGHPGGRDSGGCRPASTLDGTASKSCAYWRLPENATTSGPCLDAMLIDER